jgi:nucleotide-binding universal stress UspA family protein
MLTFSDEVVMRPDIRRILVPIDFSPTSDQALQYAAALAEEFGASLKIVHVIEDRLMTGPWPAEVYLGELPKLREDLVKEAERRMLTCLESLTAKGIATTGEVIIGGPSHVILEQAGTAGVDLIVMGTHGRTGITHLLIGSVAERIIRHAPCPVFVVRQKKAAEGVLEPVAVAG